ncbi:sialic acid-binding Ig-like lectin 10 [Myotis myotis]|uniref:Sialic acid binding Ig like lectin 10 n=1 Tax=Myotis myotis TaxID=51298 RepID=A0A7J7RFJ9_MYOMY|nr:sialic acid-binding Ig-like lectin 10 [Myotis myotis]KAF6274980.1 sialic acid binding Ig like lectin 10 [Myotis myotis]
MLLPLLFGVLWGGEWAEGWSPKKAQDPDKGYRLTVEKVVMVPQGLCVRVPCSFSYPREGNTKGAPVQGYWFRDGTEALSGSPVATNDQSRMVHQGARGRFQLLGSPQDGSCSLLLTKARMEDRGFYFFRVEGGTAVRYSFVNNKFFLNVAAPTQEPAVYVPETLEPGRQATAVCVFQFHSEHCPAPTLSWRGAALAPQEIGETTAYVSVLTLTPRRQDHDTDLTCRASFSREGPSFERSVRLNVAYAPETPVISISWDNRPALELHGDSPHQEAQKGQLLRLLCAADSRPPAALSWALGDRVLSWSDLPGPGGLELELPGVQPGDAGRYSCRAENRLGLRSRSLSLSVRYAPENLTVTVSRANGTVLETLGNGASLPVLEGQSLRLLCVTHSNPPASLSWARGPHTLSPSQPSDPGVLELPGVRTEHEGEFICRAQNPLGALSVSLRLSVHYPPQLLGPSCSWEDQGLHCSCSSRAQPAPSLRWRLGAGLLEGNHGNASHAVSSSSEGPWTNSSLSLSQGLSEGLRLSCEAWNVHGAQSASVLLLPGQGPGEEKDLIAKGFSKGVALGTGVTILLALGLCLCLILAVVKTLRKTQTQTPAEEAAPEAETPARTEPWRPRLTRRSTILDYINVVPNARGLARNPKAKPSSPSRAPPAAANSPGRNMPPPAPESRSSQQEIHYAALSFPGLRPQEAQQAKDTNSEYAEIRFH